MTAEELEKILHDLPPELKKAQVSTSDDWAPFIWVGEICDRVYRKIELGFDDDTPEPAEPPTENAAPKPSNMMEDEVIKLLSDCHTGDYEVDHGTADNILRDFVKSLGFTRIADAYDAVDPKYCA